MTFCFHSFLLSPASSFSRRRRRPPPPPYHPSLSHHATLLLNRQVSPHDSLAGVALKYGVTIADLRRTNQLWASDSIHLRAVLYVPFEKARQSRQFKMLVLGDGRDEQEQEKEQEQDAPAVGVSASASASTAALGASSSSSLLDDNDGSSPGLSEADSVPASTSTSRLLGGTRLTLLRVPASQLSFFPPPSMSTQLQGASPSGTRSRSRSETHRQLLEPGAPASTSTGTRRAYPLAVSASNSSSSTTTLTSTPTSGSSSRLASRERAQHGGLAGGAGVLE